MEKNTGKYLSAKYVSYEGILKHFKISDIHLQPLFEAFTNSLEAIKLLKIRRGINLKGKIIVRYHIQKNLLPDVNPHEFLRLEVEDNGIGFDDEEFERLKALNDEGKGFHNKGSGRVQFLHFFNNTEFESTYIDPESSTGFSLRKFTLSKSKPFIEKKAIIRLDLEDEIKATDTLTKVVFKNLLIQKPVCKNYYDTLTIEKLKKEIVAHYLAYFCENRNSLPEIKLEFFFNEVLKDEETITIKDIPKFEKKRNIHINYSKFSKDGKQIEKSSKKEIFKLKAFRIAKEKLATNELKLVSKGEIAKSFPVQSIGETEHIDNHRYLFLLSGDYLTANDGDTRGELNIPTKDEFKKQFSDMYAAKEAILIDDIEQKTNKTIEALYKEIKEQKEEKEKNIKKLQQMFLLDEELIKSIKIGINDTDDQILNKFYEADAKIIAKRDAFIKQQVTDIEKLNPADSNYEEDLITQIDELVKTIPLQNRTALTHYVARRKLVLDVFEKILRKQLEIQRTTERNIDERLLHTLLFQQSSTNPKASDLWLINEDFIYFKGTSESKLGEILIDGEKLMKEILSEEEIKYRDSLEEKRYEKRPDVLLFPEEGKCIIIEFKNPNVNVSEHISQINNYASLIRNLSKDEFQIDTFYGYLVGEKIDSDDVQNKEPYFENAYNFDYLYRTHFPVRGKFERKNGSLYTEIIKYSTLLERAQLRNDIFIKKLTDR